MYVCSLKIVKFFRSAVLPIVHGPFQSRQLINSPLTQVWSMANEKFYARWKLWTAVGTMSTGKQGMQAAFISYGRGHACRKTLKFRAAATAKEDDTLCYAFREGRHNFYKIIRVSGDQLRAKEVQVEKYHTSADRWANREVTSAFGIYKFCRLGATVQISIDDIKGKALRVLDTIQTVPDLFNY